MMLLAIARHELRRIFMTPLAWIILAVFQVLIAITFFTLADQYQRGISAFVNHGLTIIVVAGTLQSAGLLLLFITPYLGMRLISEERRSGTLTLLLSSPVSLWEIVGGKYLGMLGFCLVLLLLAGLLPLSLATGTRLDYGLLAAGMLGLLLLSAVFTAIGMFASTLTRQPVAAAFLAFTLVFIFWILHILGNTDNAILNQVIAYLSLQRHFNNLLSGLVSTYDVVYFFLLGGVFTLLSILRLEGIRRYN